MKKIFGIFSGLLFLLIIICCDVFAMEVNQEIVSVPIQMQKEFIQKKSKAYRVYATIKKEIVFPFPLQKSISVQSLDKYGMEKDPQIIKKQKKLYRKKSKIDPIQETIEKEMGLDLTSAQETSHNLWLRINNKTTTPLFKTPVTVEVCDTQKSLIKTLVIQSEGEVLKHFNFEKITYALSIFKAHIYDKNDKNQLLKLTAFRQKNHNQPAYLDVILQNKDKTFDKRILYEETEDNYLIIVNLDRYEELYLKHAVVKQEQDRKKRRSLKIALEKEIDVNGGFLGSNVEVKPVPQEEIIQELKENKEKNNNSYTKMKRAS